jgi:lipopolysaccharide export system permease protein
MFGSILHRMIFSELVKVFLLSLCGLTGLFMLGVVIQEASQRGLSPGQILPLIPLLLPSMLPYTIPATTLFAACVVYGRMAHDNEIVVLKAAGVNLYSVLKPAVLLGLLTAGSTLGLAHFVIPATQQTLRRQLLSDPKEAIYSVLRRDRALRYVNFPYVMYVRDVQGERLIDVILKQRKEEVINGQKLYVGYDYVFRAREARIRVDAEAGQMKIALDRCVVYNPNVHGESVPPQEIPIALPEALSGKDIKTKPMTMTFEELRAARREEAARRDELAAELKVAEQAAAAATDPLEKNRQMVHVYGLTYKVKDAARAALNYECELHMRPALAVGCLCFVLVGVPVGIWANRADYLSTFVVCFLPTVFAYYPLVLAGGNMSRDGKVPVPVGVWAADAALAVASLFLIAKLMKR